MLLCDGEMGAEIYAAATRRDQARIIFDEARRMVASSPELQRRVNRFKLNLSVDRTGSKFEPLSSDERTLDGLNPHCVLIDELHKHRTRSLLDVLDTALGARRQPLIWIITTAGDDNPESVYAAENDYAIKVLEGTIEDDNVFAFISTIDKGDRWDDPKAWAKANPNIGVSSTSATRSNLTCASWASTS
jgi:phage terminase large subunit-like protein